MSISDRLPDYPVNSDFVRKLKSALEGRDEARLRDLICADVGHVDAVIELANDDWMKDPSAPLPPGVLVGNRHISAGFPPVHAQGVGFGVWRADGQNRRMIHGQLCDYYL